MQSIVLAVSAWRVVPRSSTGCTPAGPQRRNAAPSRAHAVNPFLQMGAGGMAHRCQFSIVNLAGETDLHLGAREGIRVVVEPEYRAAKLVRYRETPDVEIKIGFHVFHVERLWGNRLLVVGS